LGIAPSPRGLLEGIGRGGSEFSSRTEKSVCAVGKRRESIFHGVWERTDRLERKRSSSKEPKKKKKTTSLEEKDKRQPVQERIEPSGEAQSSSNGGLVGKRYWGK